MFHQILHYYRESNSLFQGIILGLIIIVSPVIVMSWPKTVIQISEAPVFFLDANGNLEKKWEGEDDPRIRRHAEKKTREIVSALFANSANQDEARLKTTKAMNNFVEDTEALKFYSMAADNSQMLAASGTATGFIETGIETRYLEEYKVWVTEITGEWLHDPPGKPQVGYYATLRVGWFRVQKMMTKDDKSLASEKEIVLGVSVFDSKTRKKKNHRKVSY